MAEAARLLASGRPSAALSEAVLAGPEGVLSVVTAAKLAAEELDKAVAALSPAEVDGVMSALYLGLSKGDAAVSASCLRWHDRLVSAHGTSGIVRHLAREREGGEAHV